MAGNPDIINMVVSVPSVSSLAVKETLYCFSKVSTALLPFFFIWFEALNYHDLINFFILFSFFVLFPLGPAQMLTYPNLILSKQSALLDLLKSFQPKNVSDISDIQSLSSTGDLDCLYGGVYTFLEGVLDVGMVFLRGGSSTQLLNNGLTGLCFISSWSSG